MQRSQSVKLMVLFLGAAAVTVTSAYLWLREPPPNQQADQIAAIWPKDESLEETLKQQFVGGPTSALLRHFRVDFDALNLHQEPPGRLDAASFYVRHKEVVVQVRVHFVGDDDDPSRWLFNTKWTSEFVGSLKISDFEVKPAHRQ